MFKRKISSTLQRYLQSFPAILVSGARQVGKTTLLRGELGSYRYVLLEDPDVREHALLDPRGFLERHSPPVIFDEFQYAPLLLNYLQGIIDQDRENKGRYVLTGSQSFEVMSQASQSLAGRVGILNLYGLWSGECPDMRDNWQEQDLARAIFRGTYPELWAQQKILPTDWFASYLRTYIERDIRNLVQVGDLMAFERFVRLCAIRTGQLLNVSDLSRDAGVSATTAQRWISLLTRTFLIHLVQPFHENLSSRIKKAPKIYFLDGGLATFLMGFKDPQTLLNAPQWGQLFETWVIGEWIKREAADGILPEHCFLESKTGIGVDLMVRNNGLWDLYEIKSTRTIVESSLRQIKRTAALLGARTGRQTLVAPVREKSILQNIQICPWQEI